MKEKLEKVNNDKDSSVEEAENKMSNNTVENWW